MQTCDWEVTADESSGSLRFCRPWCFFFDLIKYYFAFKTRLKISDQKLLNFAECIAGKGKFCGRKLRKKLRRKIGLRTLESILVFSRPKILSSATFFGGSSASTQSYHRPQYSKTVELQEEHSINMRNLALRSTCISMLHGWQSVTSQLRDSVESLVVPCRQQP